MLAAGAAEIGFALWAFYYHYMCMDHAEHIHAAWLVWQGQVPYRDFFQHHNPLLWYLFAPVTQLFYRDTAIVYAARVAAILGWGAVLYKLYALVCAGFGGRAAGSAGA